jgi:uncharacterized membrane protein YkvA (DUF1232 family)
MASTDRRGSAGALWRALRRARRRGGPSTATLLRTVPRMVTATLTGRYPGLGRGRLALGVLAAVYVLSPVDVLPEGLLGPIGLLDDAAVLAWLAGAVLAETEAFLTWERAGRPSGTRGPGEPHVVAGQVVR